MLTLAVDTATSALSVALFAGANVIAEGLLNGRRQHGEILVPAVSSLLEQAGYSVEDVSEVVVGVGPGSYTGLRMGVTFAKTWASASKIQLHSVSSLALMGAQTGRLENKEDMLVVPVIDARRQTVYTGAYRWNEQETRLEVVEADRHIAWEMWLEVLRSHLSTDIRQIVLVGQELDEFLDNARSVLPDVVVRVYDALPHVNKLNRVTKQLVSEVALLVPNYCHTTLAEQEWQARNNGESNDETLVEHLL